MRKGGGELYISVGRRGAPQRQKRKNEKDGRALKSNSAALRDAARRRANLAAWQTDGHGGAFSKHAKGSHLTGHEKHRIPDWGCGVFGAP